MDSRTDPSSPLQKTNVGQRVILSMKSALAGWLAFVSFCLAGSLLQAVGGAGTSAFVALYLFGLGSAVVVFAVWVFVALPLALLIPDRSFFWEPGVLPIIGVVAGMLMVCAYQLWEFHSNPTIRVYDWREYIIGDVLLPCLPAGFIGGVIGGVATHLHRNLSHKQPVAGD